jgi:anaphase-promoting complex subunit 1
MPDVVKAYYTKFRRKAEKSSGIDGLATFAAMRMSGNKSDAGDVQMEGSDNHNSSDEGQLEEAAMKDDLDMEVDYNSIRQAHVYITSGICFSLGLRYAGTGNEVARAAIFKKVLELQKLRDGNDSISLALRPDTPTVDMCLGSAAISLAMVMAGTGDLEVFRLFKTLRWKCDMDVKYGNHMAYASAIGLLFLGGGSCTLGNEPSDIAALVVSMFPRVPIFTHDNRYHLQALPHLYALAVKERKVEAIDVDSNEKVLLPMKVSESYLFRVDHVDFVICI